MRRTRVFCKVTGRSRTFVQQKTCFFQLCYLIHQDFIREVLLFATLVQSLQINEQLFRSSHWRCSIKKAALKKFTIFTRKYLCWSLFLIKLQAFRENVSGLIKKRVQHRCSPVNIAKFLRIPILKTTCERLLLSFLVSSCTSSLLIMGTALSIMDCLQLDS